MCIQHIRKSPPFAIDLSSNEAVNGRSKNIVNGLANASFAFDSHLLLFDRAVTPRVATAAAKHSK